jgi:hypothetical protein
MCFILSGGGDFFVSSFFLERTAKALPQFLLDDRKEKKESFTKKIYKPTMTPIPTL